jgi:putative multicomponent Na+:H+ antiporter subunit B
MDSYIYAIMLLLPLAAAMVIVQGNPYQALVMRGILGAIAALVYAMLGGADVALTEALVGTMLAITLYAVAVRSSLVMRLGVLKPEEQPDSQHWQSLLDYLRATLKRYQLRLELVPYTDEAALQQALASKEVHGICLSPGVEQTSDDGAAPVLLLRVRRLYEIFSTELPEAIATARHSPPQASDPLTPAPTLTEEHL